MRNLATQLWPRRPVRRIGHTHPGAERSQGEGHGARQVVVVEAKAADLAREARQLAQLRGDRAGPGRKTRFKTNQ